MDSDTKILLISGVIFVLLFFMIVRLSSFADAPQLQIGEIFIITDEETKYSCIITETENDLALNCLRAE